MQNNKSKILNLIDKLPKDKKLYIQTHNFPDPDAVAAAYALGELLAEYGIQSELVYYGFVERLALNKMIQELDIPIRSFYEKKLSKEDKVLIVDGCKGLKNVYELQGYDLGIIDHHEVEHPDNVEFIDIRPDAGSTSSIVCEYYLNLEVEMKTNVATALMIGLIIDTANLSRGISEIDFAAYDYLRKRADMAYVRKTTKNNIELADLSYFREALSSFQRFENKGFIYLDKGCRQNLLGILADFFIAITEIDVVVIAAQNHSSINFSVRSEPEVVNSADLIRQALQGIGNGGGHDNMAGGLITDKEWIAQADQKKIYGLFKAVFPDSPK